MRCVWTCVCVVVFVCVRIVLQKVKREEGPRKVRERGGNGGREY